MIAISTKPTPSYEELKYVMDQYNALNETYQEVVKQSVNIEKLQNKYDQHAAYIEDINKITHIDVSVEGGAQINVGASSKIIVSFPEGVVNKNVEYDVDKVGIVDIKEDGSIYAIKEGKVKITVSTLSGVSETIELSVVAPASEVTRDNCSNCSSNAIIKHMILFSTIIGFAYIIMKRGAKNA